MAFESIPPVPPAQLIIDQALAEGRRKPVRKAPGDTPLAHTRKRERERVATITRALQERLRRIPRAFPSVDALSEFYRELLSTETDLDAYRERLGRIDSSARVLGSLLRSTRGRIEAAAHVSDVDAAVRAFIGRAASVIERLDADLAWLEQVRRRLQAFPTVKDAFTVCIAGFPNVGKTTLLSRLTGATAEINEYAFTTKSLNLGYHRIGHEKVQFIDTPGTLNRERINPIERQAHLALKYLADVILYVYDPTEEYSLVQQETLRARMDEYGVPVYEYLSKQDIADPAWVEAFRKTHRDVDEKEFLEELQRLRKAR